MLYHPLIIDAGTPTELPWKVDSSNELEIRMIDLSEEDDGLTEVYIDTNEIVMKLLPL